MFCDFVPCSVVLVLDPGDDSSLRYLSRCCEDKRRLWQHNVLVILRKRFFFAEVCASSSASDEPSGQKLSGNSKLSNVLDRVVRYSISAVIYLTITRWLSPMESSIFPLFLSVEAVRGWTLRGWSAICLFTYLKCFTERLTLLARIQASPYARWCR
jgi:hypothetical protein